jgi:hypothetical protein
VRHAMRALEAVGQHHKLERLSVTLQGIKLVQLPGQLESLPQLYSLELRYDPQVGGNCTAASSVENCSVPQRICLTR